jgi:replicative superfamily II helicase
MKFENLSSTVLSITKSKAKMYEFGLEEEHHIKLPIAPSRLLIMTIAMLGDICQLELNDKKSEVLLAKTQKELRNVASYFDSLIQTQLEVEYEYYLCLLGSSSYYLANMPGSSSVLAQRLAGTRKSLTLSGLEYLLEWLLLNDIDRDIFSVSETFATRYIEEIKKEFINFYQLVEESSTNLMQLVNSLRQHCYDRGNDRELFLADIIRTILLKRISSSTISLLPKYTELEIETWRPILTKKSFIKEFWPAQQLLGEQGVFSGRSAVIQLPTSAGKTKSAEVIIRAAFLSKRTQVALIIAPFRSLCREISESLADAFLNESILVNQLNDVPQIDDFDIELLAQIFSDLEPEKVKPTVIVSTPEKFVYLLRHQPELADHIALAIYDEGHQFDDNERGVTYELLLTSLKQQLDQNTQHVLISAVISNGNSIGDWLYAGEGAAINGSEYLATARSIAFSSWTGALGQFHYFDPMELEHEEFFVPRVLKQIPIPMKARERVQRYFPNKTENSSVAAYLGLKLSEYGSVAIFCGTKASVHKICKTISETVERIQDIQIPITLSSREEIEKITRLSSQHLGDDSVLTKAISLGVLPHSRAVPNGLRTSIEYAMEHGLGRCVVCTSTLAQGVNLPIKYLIVSGVFQGGKRISTRNFHNLLGRVGRSGMHTEGSVIFTDTELFDQRQFEKKWHWKNMQGLLDSEQSEHCSSSLLSLVKPFENDILGIEPIEFIKDPEKYIQLCIKEVPKQDNKDLLSQMEMRKKYIKTVESYLLANSPTEGMFGEEEIAKLCANTLAYSLADDLQKANLQIVFEMVALTVNEVAPNNRVVFGKALLGIADLNVIKNWLSDNVDILSQNYALEVWLEILWPLSIKILDSESLDKLVGEDAGIFIAKKWISGKSYVGILDLATEKGYQFIYRNKATQLKVENILDVCDGALGYDLMLIVGAIADLMESIFSFGEQADEVRMLQRSLKLGLSSSLEHWLFAQGLSDRVICKDLAEWIVLLGDEKDIGDSFFLNHKDYLGSILDGYPTVFSRAVYP